MHNLQEPAQTCPGERTLAEAIASGALPYPYPEYLLADDEPQYGAHLKDFSAARIYALAAGCMAGLLLSATAMLYRIL